MGIVGSTRSHAHHVLLCIGTHTRRPYNRMRRCPSKSLSGQRACGKEMRRASECVYVFFFALLFAVRTCTRTRANTHTYGHNSLREQFGYFVSQPVCLCVCAVFRTRAQVQYTPSVHESAQVFTGNQHQCKHTHTHTHIH